MGKAGIQIYTLRSLANHDLPAAINMIKDAGYAGIEFDAGMINRAKPQQLKGWMDDANLSVIGLTLLMPELGDMITPMLDYAQITGAEWLVMPWIDEKFRKKIEDYENIAQRLNHAGHQAADQGVRFAYHIHGYEFLPLGHKQGFDVLIENLDPSYVELQVDTFWVASGGVNVHEFSKKYIDWIGSFHFKDAASLNPLTNIEVGEGILDLESLVDLGISHGIEWYIVEQEATQQTLPESIKISSSNLRTMLNNTQAKKT